MRMTGPIDISLEYPHGRGTAQSIASDTQSNYLHLSLNFFPHIFLTYDFCSSLQIHTEKQEA